MTDDIETPPADAPPTDAPPADAPPADAPPTSMGTPPEGPNTGWFNPAAEDWREQMAGDDEARLNQLKRISDPNALIDSYFNAQEKIRSGETQMTEAGILPANPTEEQLAAHREANGIPESADKYELTLSEGLVLSDEDRQEFQPLFEYLHDNNIPGETASGIVDKYMQVQNHIAAQEQAQDSTDAAVATKALQDAWGGDFEQNKNLISGMLSAHFPEDAIESFMGARLAGGQALFNHPGLVAALANMARTINPAATLVPSGQDALKSMDARKAELESKMGTDEWYKNSSWQKEYQDIVSAQETMNARQTQ